MDGHRESIELIADYPPPPGSGQSFLPSVPLPEDVPSEPVGISDMANLFGVTHRTLHFYEEKNLLSASRIGLMRVYYHRDIARMAVINTCRETGMPVAAIQDLMADLAEAVTQAEADRLLNDALEARKRELVSAQSLILRQMQQINALMTRERTEEEEPVTRLAPHGIELSDMEHHCLSLMAEGYTQLRVARNMHLTPEAAQALEQSIMRKLKATNRFQAVAKAVLLGLVAS
ncbi:MerR family transcriptional regulator [Rhizobium paknamense]|uniref:DNA-binding transcriptional MerR regulator n=1 Tax=Rhizobium paknamense TaxID=1206817 RepID=A0ABU0I9E4_9HYPH|nr:MerR family transcriptional regulator [Rhizobium paknamense]MDQ0454862.1 DNA-binding transcriptional MerR regulator [Rhizobium paknamense]